MNNQKIPLSGDQRAQRSGNLITLILWRYRFGRGLAAAGLGILLSLAFAPGEMSWVAWVGLVPFMALAFNPHHSAGWLGYAFGLGHFTTSFYWLKEVFLPGPLLLASVCAIFPAFWASLSKALLDNLTHTQNDDLLPRHDPARPVNTGITVAWKLPLIIWMFAFIWIATEWVRGWFCTGFPWNQIGVSQWQNLGLISSASVTGVAGIGFLIVTVNAAIYFVIRRFDRSYAAEKDHSAIIPLLTIIVTFIPFFMMRQVYRIAEPDDSMAIAAVQGNLPQSRVWSAQQLHEALAVYPGLTRTLVSASSPELILWPETAIPASITADPVIRLLIKKMIQEVNIPLLAGTIDYRYPVDTATIHSDISPLTANSVSFNSAVLFDDQGEVGEIYDKIHLVPFGEYTPFEEYLPWLTDWIGMGRSLTAGKAFTIMPLKQARIGVNICYEDVFPEISYNLVRHGANLLVVITNDAWFGETSGSRQHLAHSVFRAVENRRPLLRNGNNSDTCLIMPDGEVRDLLYDEDIGNRFVRDSHVYQVPLYPKLPTTFFTRYGNWFAECSALITLMIMAWCCYRYLDRKRRLFQLINQRDSGL